MPTLAGEGRAHRVGVLGPAPADGALITGSVHLVRPHPSDREAAVLDVGAEPADIEAARSDPRWRTVVLPSEGVAAGGWGAAAGGRT